MSSARLRPIRLISLAVRWMDDVVEVVERARGANKWFT